MNEYTRWLQQQLNRLDCPEFDESTGDDLRLIVTEAIHRGALVGVVGPDVRPGGLSPSLARKLLAECLAACPDDERPMLTPPQLAREWGISPDKVLRWIRSGELKARNVSQGTRPRYLIDRSDIESFRPVQEKPTPSHRQRPDPDVIEFYR